MKAQLEEMTSVKFNLYFVNKFGKQKHFAYFSITKKANNSISLKKHPQMTCEG